jgi:hypothetical protein
MKERMTFARLRGIAEHVSAVIGYQIEVANYNFRYHIRHVASGDNITSGLTAGECEIALRAMARAAYFANKMGGQ